MEKYIASSVVVNKPKNHYEFIETFGGVDKVITHQTIKVDLELISSGDCSSFTQDYIGKKILELLENIS